MRYIFALLTQGITFRLRYCNIYLTQDWNTNPRSLLEKQYMEAHICFFLNMTI